ncbi:MAG: acetylesterase [Clostridia bacterium]|nr:acetylesterase [Clostridia bacterium]
MAILTAEIFSQCLNRNTQIRVIIPADDLNGFRSGPFKTLYLLHGVYGTYNDWINRTGILGIAEKNSLAVVMPDGANDFYVDNPKAAKNYGEYIGRELIQITRGLFPLSDNREDTFIGGLSMGGYGALRAGLKYSDTFSKIIALSTAVINQNGRVEDDSFPFFPMRKGFLDSVFGDFSTIGDTGNDLITLIESQANIKNKPSIYFSCGRQDDFYNDNVKFYKLANELGFDCTADWREGYHEWGFWNSVIGDAVKWL